jgi:hypothetical protein
MAIQTAQASSPFEVHCHIAPEPRDIVWANMSISPRSKVYREVFVLGVLVLLFLFWIVPIDTLAMLLSYQQIKDKMPWLGRLIDRDERVRAVVQNSLPSIAMISLNAIIPFLLEGWYIFHPGVTVANLTPSRTNICTRIQSSKSCGIFSHEKVFTCVPGTIIVADRLFIDISCSCWSTSSLSFSSLQHTGSLFRSLQTHLVRFQSALRQLCPEDEQSMCIVP